MNPWLVPLAAGFRVAAAIRVSAYRHGVMSSRRLARPVISVGNLTMGGTGKTPLVEYIASRCLARGLRPAILTRGYGRENQAAVVIIEPQSQGRTADPRRVGDEPALLARALSEVPILVSADRYRAGRLAEERFHAGVHVLDDGFQHLALARDVDVVAVDATQGLSDWALVPAGRQRESCGALARADLVVITRADLAETATIEARIHCANRRALIFHATTRLAGLVDVQSGRARAAEEFAAREVCAFCGIGNPRAFFADLGRWGFRVALEKRFRDHHLYQRSDLAKVISFAKGIDAAAIMTTEKDAMNLPPLEPLSIPIVACQIQVELREAEAFEQALFERLDQPR